MASLTLRDITKVYPNAEGGQKKKKKKHQVEEPGKEKANLQITD